MSLLVYSQQQSYWVISHHYVTLSLSLRGHLLPNVSSWCRHDVTMSVSPVSVPSPRPETVGAERRKAVSSVRIDNLGCRTTLREDNDDFYSRSKSDHKTLIYLSRRNSFFLKLSVSMLTFCQKCPAFHLVGFTMINISEVLIKVPHTLVCI